jgi:threonine 3-dehydrogenase
LGKAIAVVTGAGGELGSELLPALARQSFEVVAVDRKPLSPELGEHCVECAQLDITDRAALGELIRRRRPSHLFHLAAMLSSDAEREPERAHRVNVEGTLGLLQILEAVPSSAARPRFIFPSTIAVYGLPDAAVKERAGAVEEWQWTCPLGIYGCNKLYCELLGAHASRRGRLDFRALRFPGLISATSLPSGGTTDFAPQMLHAAAQGQAYACFVSAPTRLPFMTMPDAVDALLRLAGAEAARLSAPVYNVRGFSCSAGEFRERILQHFPQAQITFEPQPDKQRLVDSWPADLDDTRARRDWGHAPTHDLDAALQDYLVPRLCARYSVCKP